MNKKIFSTPEFKIQVNNFYVTDIRMFTKLHDVQNVYTASKNQVYIHLIWLLSNK